jgi:DNA-binding CsgD family transcriptional regulator
MSQPENTDIYITAEEIYYGTPLQEKSSSFFLVEKRYNTDQRLAVCLWYSSGSTLVEREKKLIASAASLLANALSKNTYFKRIKEQAEELEVKNTALKEILFQIRKEREDFITTVSRTSGTFIQPLIYELEGTVLNQRQNAILNQLKMQIEALFSEQGNNMEQFADILTPRELEICALVKNGESTKEIAALLGIAPQTVERHRNTIRKKLGINKKGINLINYLRNRY